MYKIKSKEQFNIEIETLVNKGGYTYLSAINFLCQKYKIEEEMVLPMLDAPVFDKLKNESVSNNVFKGTKKSKKLRFKKC